MRFTRRRIDAAEDLRSIARPHRMHSESLLRAAGALQLLPENATKWVRLARLVEVARAVRPARRQRPISAADVRWILTNPPVADASVLCAEDPFETPFVVPVAYDGTEYLTVAGTAGDAATTCQFLLDALDDLPGDAEPARTLMRQDAIRLLRLSDLVARRAGLERWQAPTFDSGPDMHVPETDEFETLRKAVVVRNCELGHRMGGIEQYESWCRPRRPLDQRRDPAAHTDDRAFRYPMWLASSRDRLIVASPNQLALATVHRMASLALEYGIAAQLVTAFEQMLLAEANRLCRLMRWTPAEFPADLESASDIREELFRFDADKFAHVIVVADPLDDFDPAAPWAMGNTAERTGRIARRVERVRRVVQARRAGTCVMHVVLRATIGRPFATWLAPDSQQTWSLLPVSIDELRTLAEYERGDPLGLWWFSKVEKQLSVPLHGLTTDVVDLYARYLECDRRPDLMGIGPNRILFLSPGYGAPPAVELRRRNDVHAVQLHSSTESVLVQRETDEAPAVYVPQRPELRYLRLLELAVPCWIRATGMEDIADRISLSLANAVAFNLWRLRDIVDIDLLRIAESDPSISSVLVDIVGASGDDLLASSADTDAEGPWFQVTADPTHNRVGVRLLPNAALLLAQASGNHEAELISEIVMSIATLSGRTRGDAASDLDNAGALGLPRLLHMGIGFVPGVHGTGDLPSCRRVRKSELQAVDDYMGTVAHGLGLKFGEVPKRQRASVSEKVLRALNDKLRSGLGGLDAGSAFELFVSEQERMENDRAKLRVRQPGALTPGSDDADKLEALQSFGAINESALAGRYLIETAVRVVGAGDEPMTLSRYDELMAVSMRLIDFGLASDADRNRLAEVDMYFLEPGRLIALDDDPFFFAVTHQVSSAARRLIQKDTLADWDLRHRDEGGEEFAGDGIWAAFESEFDVPLRDLVSVVQCLKAIAASQANDVITMPVDDLKRRLVAEAGVSVAHAARCVEMLSLNSSLLDPNPDLFDIESTPWRFSRDLSFQRRPVLIRNDGSGDMATWGARAPGVALDALLDNIYSGRYTADTDEMKQYIRAEEQSRSDAFDEKVADVFRGEAHCDVKVRASSIGNSSLRRKKGQTIGDIDVLVTNHAAQVLVIIENKDFSTARTMREHRAELDKLMHGKKAAVPRHTERVEFVRQRWPRLHREMKLAGAPSNWVIRDVIVTGASSAAVQVLLTPDATGGIEIISFEQLLDPEYRASLFSVTER